MGVRSWYDGGVGAAAWNCRMDGHARTMNYKELQRKIKDIYSAIEVRYLRAMENWYCYRQLQIKNDKVPIKPQPSLSEFRHFALLAIDNAKVKYCMQTFPVRVGHIIYGTMWLGKGQNEGRCVYMKVERITAASTEVPTLLFFGTWLRQDGQPYVCQSRKPMLQCDIISYGKTIKRQTFIREDYQ